MNETKYTIKNPFQSEILKVTQLNKEGSTKSNHFVEFSLKGSGILYDVGCSFGLLPDNEELDVTRILSHIKCTGDENVTPKKVGREITLKEFFLSYANLSRITKKIASALLPHQKDERLKQLLEGEWKDYTEHHDLEEFLGEYFEEGMNIQELVDLIGPMMPRFYSVASSQKVMGDTLQLFIADFSYERGKKNNRSLTTQHILNKNSIRLFHQPNPSFTIPEDNTPIIMIGPGTGLAAFLGFIQERIYNKHPHNLLFMGDRNRDYDFYFEEALKSHQQHGNLKLFCAFSRDGAHKVYVQDRIWQEKELIFDLLENKDAHVFISGDATRMAKDVVACFEKIIADQKQISPDEAHTQLQHLKKEKRFHLDVY